MTDPEPITADCCICGELGIGYGNNAQPIANGRCCDLCNTMHVIPARIIMANLQSRAMTNPPGPSESND